MQHSGLRYTAVGINNKLHKHFAFHSLGLGLFGIDDRLGNKIDHSLKTSRIFSQCKPHVWVFIVPPRQCRCVSAPCHIIPSRHRAVVTVHHRHNHIFHRLFKSFGKVHSLSRVGKHLVFFQLFKRKQNAHKLAFHQLSVAVGVDER